jgi:hypothetical protein
VALPRGCACERRYPTPTLAAATLAAVPAAAAMPTAAATVPATATVPAAATAAEPSAAALARPRQPVVLYGVVLLFVYHLCNCFIT